MVPRSQESRFSRGNHFAHVQECVKIRVRMVCGVSDWVVSNCLNAICFVPSV